MEKIVSLNQLRVRQMIHSAITETSYIRTMTSTRHRWQFRGNKQSRALTYS